MPPFIQQWDWTILHWIHGHLHSALLDQLMPFITTLGNGGAIWVLCAIVLSFTKTYRRYGILLLVTLAIGSLFSDIYLKQAVARPRPSWIEHVHLLIHNPKDYSFPSGHTLSSVIGAYIIYTANPTFGRIAVVLAVLIAFSRLYLYVHFPSDVLMSVIIGIALASTAIWAMRSLAKRK